MPARRAPRSPARRDTSANRAIGPAAARPRGRDGSGEVGRAGPPARRVRPPAARSDAAMGGCRLAAPISERSRAASSPGAAQDVLGDVREPRPARVHDEHLRAPPGGLADPQVEDRELVLARRGPTIRIARARSTSA